LKANLLCIGWSNKKIGKAKMHGTTVKKKIRHTYSEIKQYWHAVPVARFFYAFVHDICSPCSALIHISKCETKQWSSLWWIFWHTCVISGSDVESKCIKQFRRKVRINSRPAGNKENVGILARITWDEFLQIGVVTMIK
jgi:hypothetical protein